MVGRGMLYGEKRNAFSILIGKPKGKRPFEGLKRRWGDNIKWILMTQGGRERPGVICLRIERSGGGGLL